MGNDGGMTTLPAVAVAGMAVLGFDHGYHPLRTVMNRFPQTPTQPAAHSWGPIGPPLKPIRGVYLVSCNRYTMLYSHPSTNCMDFKFRIYNSNNYICADFNFKKNPINRGRDIIKNANVNVFMLDIYLGSMWEYYYFLSKHL